MTTIESTTTTIQEPEASFEFDEAHLAAASFLARYSGRTLEAYRHDLRGFFQWAADHGIDVLQATRPHIKLFRELPPIRRTVRVWGASCSARGLVVDWAEHLAVGVPALRVVPGLDPVEDRQSELLAR